MNKKRICYFVIAMLALITLISIGWRVTHGGSRLAEGVTVEAIRIVQNGMTEEEVVAILGDPVERAPSPCPSFPPQQ